jgi:SAM-dependent methyltransferase
MMAFLERSRLLVPTFTLYERALAHHGRSSEDDQVSVDGLDVPSRRLRVLVSGSPDLEWFLQSGREAAGAIHEALAASGVAISQQTKVLDFGCGCGRVARHWPDFPGEFWGTDANEDLVEWCRGHLHFGTFIENGAEPPLPVSDDVFDAVYAISVFTHLTEAAQSAWIAELARVVRPGGKVIFTTHGDAYAGALSSRERDLFESGRLVVRHGTASGRNVCAAFHPRQAVRRLAEPMLEEVAFIPVRVGRQDLYVFSKKLGAS